MRKVEVLAPAGSLDICKAVIRAGADAVYLGGDMFGARAYAGNLNREEMLEAIDFAHIRGSKIYLTVNTLLKENEINKSLVEYIKPYYEAGLDAAIVQDFGVFNLLRQEFPELALHASTQMTITGSCGAAILKNMGASRIVTARELTVDEIREIHDSVDIEIESFVHGALCYCYSGQCLLSSMNGNRSGNRGRCAQSCRLAYDVYNNSDRINNDKQNYPLSPKDMCALKVLPDVIDAGVYSLKIEGRMKNVTYASEVTNIYRRYVDMYLAKGRKGYKVNDSDVEELMDIYNRGGFTTGYYKEKNGRTMMSIERPNHMGTPALEVKENINGRITFKALRDINPQDVFEIDMDNSFSSGGSYKAGEMFVVNLPRKYPLYKGRTVFRMRNNKITQKVIDEYVDNTKNGNASVDMDMYVSQGKPVRLRLCSMGYEAVVYGAEAEAAVKSAAQPEAVREKLCKLGNTSFVPGNVEVIIDGDVFLPVAWINEIRRQGIEELTHIILDSYRRVYKPCGVNAHNILNSRSKENKVIHSTLLVSGEEQIKDVSAMLDAGYELSALYIEREVLTEHGINAVKDIQKRNVDIIAALPHIITMQDHGRIKELIKKCADIGIDTFLVRNLEELGILGKLVPGSKIVTDANMYCWNNMAYNMLKEVVNNSNLSMIRITCPYELTIKELNMLDTDCDVELIISSDIPVMVSKQCVRRTYGLCDKAGGIITINDKRRDLSYNILSKCDYCYSLMFNSERLEVDRDSDIVKNIAPDYIRSEYNWHKDRIIQAESFRDNLHEGFKAHLITGVE